MNHRKRAMNGEQARRYVEESLGDWVNEFDVDGIVTDLFNKYDGYHFDEIPESEFWNVVERHDKTSRRANRKTANNDAVEFLSILDAKGEFVGDLVTEIWENFPNATSDDVLKVARIVDEADGNPSVVEDIIENSNFSDPFLMGTMADRLLSVAPIDIRDASDVMGTLDAYYNKGFLVEMVGQSRTKSRAELIEYYQEESEYTSHRANRKRAEIVENSLWFDKTTGEVFEVLIEENPDRVVGYGLTYNGERLTVSQVAEHDIFTPTHMGLRREGAFFEDTIREWGLQPLSHLDKGTTIEIIERNGLPMPASLGHPRDAHRANRKRAGLEDYHWFFIHGLTVPEGTGDPIGYLEDYLNQYFTDVTVDIYSDSVSAEVGDGGNNIEFFIKDTGHNVNDIVYLNEDGDYRPITEIHTAKRANRKRAEYDPTDVFYNDGVWEVANEVWNSRLLDYDVTDEMVEEEIREYSEFFLGQQADQTFVDMVMNILNKNRGRTSHRANRKRAGLTSSQFDRMVDYIDEIHGMNFYDYGSSMSDVRELIADVFYNELLIEGVSPNDPLVDEFINEWNEFHAGPNKLASRNPRRASRKRN